MYNFNKNSYIGKKGFFKKLCGRREIRIETYCKKGVPIKRQLKSSRLHSNIVTLVTLEITEI